MYCGLIPDGMKVVHKNCISVDNRLTIRYKPFTCNTKGTLKDYVQLTKFLLKSYFHVSWRLRTKNGFKKIIP